MYYWMRLGDGDDYHEFHGIGEVTEELSSMDSELGAEVGDLGIGKVVDWSEYGLHTTEFHGNNYISLYYGDKNADPIRDLNKQERDEVEHALGVEEDVLVDDSDRFASARRADQRFMKDTMTSEGFDDSQPMSALESVQDSPYTDEFDKKDDHLQELKAKGVITDEEFNLLLDALYEEQRDQEEWTRNRFEFGRSQASARRAALNSVAKEFQQLQSMLEAGEIDNEEFEARLEELESRSRNSRAATTFLRKSRARLAGPIILDEGLDVMDRKVMKGIMDSDADSKNDFFIMVEQFNVEGMDYDAASEEQQLNADSAITPIGGFYYAEHRGPDMVEIWFTATPEEVDDIVGSAGVHIGAARTAAFGPFDPEESRGYTLKMYYDIVTTESAEYGDVAERGYVVDGQQYPIDDGGDVPEEDVELHAAQYASLEEMVDDLDGYSWVGWYSTNDGLYSDGEIEDYSTDEEVSYSAFMSHSDGSKLTLDELEYIHNRLRLPGNIDQPQTELPLEAHTAACGRKHDSGSTLPADFTTLKSAIRQLQSAKSKEDLVMHLQDIADSATSIVQDMTGRKASAREAAPELSAEYFIPVDTSDLDPEVLHWFHASMGDPIYAIGSRLYAYGETKASIEELEEVVSVLSSHLANPQEDDSQDDLERIQDVVSSAEVLLAEHQHLSE